MPTKLSARDPAGVLANLAKGGIERLHLGIFDIDSKLRERRIRVSDLPAVLADYRFCNVLPKWDGGDAVFAGGPYVDEPVSLDLSTIRTYPFEPKAALILGDYAGSSVGLSARELLKRQLSKAAEMGFRVLAALEFEFIVLDETADSLRAKSFFDLKAWPRDNYCWSGITAATRGDFVAELEAVMTQLEIPLYSLGVELGAGCFEATLAAQEPLRAADDAALFRLYTKAFCRKRDLTASFMAQLGADFPGLSGHVHVSLQRQDGAPVFHDPKDPDGMSAEMRAFIAGMLVHQPNQLALVAHTVNAYRRMSPGNWAPRAATWGIRTYRVAVRAVPGTPETCRVEYRIPAADTNPYLAIGYALAAGLDGIERRLVPPDPVIDDSVVPAAAALAAMPGNLGDAARRLEASPTASQFYGEPFVQRFVESRLQEESAFRKDVSPMERQRYLES